MNSRDARVPREISIVQRENVADAVDHQSYEPGVVHLRTRYAVADYQAAPFRMDMLTIGQETQLGFDNLGSLVSLSS
jgi:hypothetical protein